MAVPGPHSQTGAESPGRRTGLLVCYGLLVAQALYMTACWGLDENLFNPNLMYRSRWLQKYAAAMVGMLSFYGYCVYCFKKRWLHGLPLYGGLTALLLFDPGFFRLQYAVFPALSLAVVEATMRLQLLSRDRQAWLAQFARAHNVLLAGCGLLAIVAATRPWFMWHARAHGVLFAVVGICGFDLLNLLVTRLLGRRAKLWGYLLGAAESVLFALATWVVAVLASLGA